MTSTNELGAVPILDGAVPRTITIKAREAISGGHFVVISGTGNNPVTSGANSYAAADFEGAIAVADVRGIKQINGLALQDIASGAFGAIGTRGAYIVKCGGSVFEGTLLEAPSNHAVQTVTSGAIPNGVHTNVPGTSHIARALSAGASGTNLYCVAYFNF